MTLAFRVLDGFILGYFLVVNSAYLGLVALASVEVVRHRRRVPFAGSTEAYRSPLTDPVTIIMRAYNEGGGIVSAVQAVAALRYPTYEVVVVDDGSTDDTFELLRAAFDLVEVPRVIPADVPYRGRVRSVHRPRSGQLAQ